MTIDLAKDKLYCAQSPSWSPNGTRIAAIAYKDGCIGQSPVVAIYDARTGRQVRTVDLSPLLSQFGTAGGPVFWVSWSPDGQTLVVQTEIAPKHITVSPSGVLIPSTSPWVLLLVPAQGGAAHFIFSTDLDMQQTDDRTIWDVAGAGVAGILDHPLPQALSFRWTGDGHLVADAPLPASSVPGTFSGSPTAQLGAASFLRWRSGIIRYSYSTGPSGAVDYTIPPAAWTHWSESPVWSPGGRFFTTLRSATRLTGAPLDPARCGNNPDDPFFLACTQPAIALPDRGLAAVLAAAQAGRPGAPIGHTPSDYKWTSVSVDWRPDGKALAAILPGDGFDNQVVDPTSSFVRVTLYSTATGQPLTTLMAPHPTNSYGLTASAWSPNGAQFALVQLFGDISSISAPAPAGAGTNPFALSSVITIWGASSLAALPR